MNSKSHIETSCLGLKQSHNPHVVVIVLAPGKAERSRRSRFNARHELMGYSDDLSGKYVLQAFMRGIVLNVRGRTVSLTIG